MNDPRKPLVRLQGISKYFGGVRALDRVSLDFAAGEIVALVGDNGAGKSTLVKILSGLYAPDEGQIEFSDLVVSQLTPQQARRHGIETVHQNLLLCDNLGAAANVVLGQEPLRWRLGPLRVLDEARAALLASSSLVQVGAAIEDLWAPVRRLSGGQRQAVAIARALLSANRMIIFDEPTAALGVKQTQSTLDVIRSVAGQGVAVIFISHNLDDVFAVADRIVAMRMGQVALDGRASDLSRGEAVAAMTGMLQPPESKS
jgi:simple sugar transport system ATP-binding protein